MTRVCILGATGSIGEQALDVCRNAGYDVVAVTARTNHTGLAEICREFNPDYAVLADQDAYDEFLKNDLPAKALKGMDGITEVLEECNADIVLNSIVGSAGIIPTVHALKHCKRLALANKETLVAAGSLVMTEADRYGCEIIPVDSEHSAIFQCLQGNKTEQVSGIILTASGGPFRGYDSGMLENVTLEMALAHPNWVMGSKITIDSATLMNKGLEVIEAHWLFGIDYDDITVAVHPKSIIHSMVEYCDNSMIAQLGAPDMRVPIQYALTYPERMGNRFKKLDVFDMGALEFERPDMDTFRCLALAYEAGREGGTMPCVMNAANEAAVELFLKGKIKFTDIPGLVERTMQSHDPKAADDMYTILESDRWARMAVYGG